MRIKYPFIRPYVDLLLNKLPYTDSMFARYGMTEKGERLKAGEKIKPEDWVEIWIGRLDRDLYVDFSPDEDKKEHKDKLQKDAIYIPIANKRGPTETENDFLHYFTPDTFLLCQNYIRQTNDREPYMTRSLIDGVLIALNQMGFNAVMEGAKIEINNKMVARFSCTDVVDPYMFEEIYFILYYDEAKFTTALPGDLYSKFHRSVCKADLATEKLSGISGVKNECLNFNEREFFQRLCDFVLKGKI